jgi:hypothetical protein
MIWNPLKSRTSPPIVILMSILARIEVWLSMKSPMHIHRSRGTATLIHGVTAPWKASERS